ncbi:DNA polymerase subunit gamma-1, mitochondrial [Frankliniella fusca]|uniref:DNA polymerase subunit gamma-1 n=1 Tax=Frankliniella fusca TaxID=407009 RepID=A0AAE1HLC1_9NEOP|nr:DNA polymerase subunit gamma-1, mitochondrial [Frankliniella fusca]
MILNHIIRSPKALKKIKVCSLKQNGHTNQSTDSSAILNAEASYAIPKSVEHSSKDEETNIKPTGPSRKQNDGTRINPCGIQMLPSSIYQHLFGKQNPPHTDKDVRSSQANLKKYGLKIDSATSVPEVDLKLPPLEGRNVEEHFLNIGKQQSEPYRLLIENLTEPLPEKPSVWELQAGWTKYVPGNPPLKVNFPEEDAIVIDVEVCQHEGPLPTLAIAASPTAWYGWVSSSLTNGGMSLMKEEYTTQHLIPLENISSQKVSSSKNLKKPKVAVGHNVMYDRARFREQYLLEPTGMRFVDTMSLHICVSGVTSYQKAILTRAKKLANSNQEELTESDELTPDAEDLASLQASSSLNGLAEVLKLYCGKQLDKAGRDVFIDGTLHDVKCHFQSSMSYCASDVSATHDILRSLFPLFVKRFPHPVTLAGMLEISMAYLPVNRNWTQYIENSEQAFQDLGVEARFQLARRADEACGLLHGEKFRDDLWMWDQDWSLQELRLTKRKIKQKEKTEEKDGVIKEMEEEADVEPHIILDELNRRKEEFEEKLQTSSEVLSLIATGFQLPLRPPHLPGYPTWYRKLCEPPKTDDWSPGPQLITTKMQVAPKLLRLTWENYPLHFIRGQGWGSLRPFDSNQMSCTEDSGGLPLQELVAYWNSIPCEKRKYGGDVEICKGVMFSRLPHKNGPGLRVGDPLGRDFIVKFSENVLAGDAVAERMMDIARKLSYWRNNRVRIIEQLVIWLSSKDLPRNLEDEVIGAILPQLIVCGTLTRRAVERTWMTASNISKERIGSELRAMVQAPPGYSIVGADVDSQELWIASLIGDAHASKIHGGTPFGWMTISGRKSEGTDMHSVTAKAVGISRDHAKVINYARIYGAGIPFAEQLLKQFNPSMTLKDAKSKARKMFSMTKGQRMYVPKTAFVGTVPNGPHSAYDATVIANQFGTDKKNLFRLVWNGGTESAVFNRLEEIAYDRTPSTPFLGGRLSRALENQREKNLPTRINWVVQSGAVDFLHLLLVAFKWLEPNARFCLSFHDEVRYLVPENRAHHAALSLHAAHLLTRAFCASRLGLTDLPLSVAFFTSVEVDKTLRKEAHDNCQTPSNPHGLLKGYGIPAGESLDIYKAIDKAGGPNALIATLKRMSVATKRKHVMRSVLAEELEIPKANQEVVKIRASVGNNLHEVETQTGETYLVSMPSRFRKSVWVKRGDFILVEPIAEGDKVRAEMIRPITSDYMRFLRDNNTWPSAFEKVESDEDQHGGNPNRRPINNCDSSCSEDSDDEN